MKNAKKILAGFMCIASLAIGMTGVNASASGNYTDSYLKEGLFGLQASFTVNATSTNKTKTREKLDYTSASIRIDSVSVSGEKAIVRVYGSKSTGGAQTDRTYGTPKVVGKASNVNTYTFCPNLVKESGESWACLGLSRSGTKNFTCKGVWSPDSI